MTHGRCGQEGPKPVGVGTGIADGIRLLVAVELLSGVHDVGRSTCINLTLHGE